MTATETSVLILVVLASVAVFAFLRYTQHTRAGNICFNLDASSDSSLLKEKVVICLELGNNLGSQASYRNQAVNLRPRGRLKEALDLHKMEEAICLQSGNNHGLQASYRNQALVLKAWRLEESLALYKEEEAICLELGNKDGLQASYRNQALVLKAWGRLEEALALLKKQEAICLELGSMARCGYCYWNWGLLAREFNDHATETQKLEAALAIFTDLEMVRERDAVQASMQAVSTP
jgi:tetratricopeptide (TPR) repeat protein